MSEATSGATAERVLFVHAHPDDETLATGATIATLVDSHAEVTVLTCTRGELGEVIPVDLRHLTGAELGEYRLGELRDALRILGVTDHRILGEANARWEGREPRQYLDSGMRWGDRGAEPLDRTDGRSLSAAEIGEVAADIAAVILAVEPDVVVSYAGDGGYGHPDHVRAHEATRTAAEVLAVPFYVVDSEGARRGPVVVEPTGAIVDRKRRALEAYGTQVVVTDDEYALSSGPAKAVAAIESFTRVRPAEPSFADYGVTARIVSLAIATGLGAFAGGLLTAAHQATTVVAGVEVPWGIVAALLIVTVLLIGVRTVFESRIIALATAIGIVVATGLLALRSVGSATFAQDSIVSYLWIFAPVLIGTVVLTWPRRDPSARASAPKTRTG